MLTNGIPFDKGIFAVGVGGGEIHHEIAVSYLAPGFIKHLDNLDNLDVFSEKEIGEYYAVQVLGQRRVLRFSSRCSSRSGAPA